MKKNTLLKAIGIVALLVVVLSWTVPASYYSGSTLMRLGLMRIGLLDLINYPFLSFQFFIQTFIYIVTVGALYGVLEKTGKYRAILEKIAKSMKGKEALFLTIVAFTFTLASSFLGLNLMLFLFIPAISAIILLMGYDKITTFLVTFISTFIGIIGSTYSTSINYYINSVTGLEYSTNLLAKGGLLIISFVVYILFTLAYAKKAKKKVENAEDKIPFIGEKKQTKSAPKILVKIITGCALAFASIVLILIICSLIGVNLPSVLATILTAAAILLGIALVVTLLMYAPIQTLFGILIVLIILGVTPWESVFKIEFFTKLHETITTWTIGEHTILAYILGEVAEFGAWSYTEISMIIAISALIIGFIYKMKLSEILENMGNGFKKMLKPALLISFAMIVVIMTGYHPFYITITEWFIGLSSKFNIFLTSILTIFGSVLNVEMIYLSQSSIPYIAGLFPAESAINSLAIITQSFYGLTMIVTPTSTMLILGLTYLDIPYIEWLKKSWKLILELFVVIIAIIFITVLI